MIYLFCSAARALYKQDALDCICYPEGHIFRFRYRKKHVDPEIWKNTQSYENKDGIMIFLDTIGEIGKQDFDFYPVRKITILRFQKEGSAIYIDFRFGPFVNYEYGKNTFLQKEWDKFFKGLTKRPWPPSDKSGRNDEEQGCFVFSNLINNPRFETDFPVPNKPWETVIEKLDKTKGLKGCTFFKILGFYEIKRYWWDFRLHTFNEDLIRSIDNSYDSIYPLPMGKSVVLKILFYRPYFDSENPKDHRTLTIETHGDSFAGLSKDKIDSSSPYNEERIILVCRRIFDSVLASVSIKQEEENKTIQAPNPFFLTKIRVP
jgi:hypothetical protein